MNKTFNYKSDTFTTQVKMKEEISRLKQAMCDTFGYNRSEIRLPHGLVVLHGYSKHTDSYLPLVSTIGEFKDWLKKSDYTDFYVSCNLEIKK